MPCQFSEVQNALIYKSKIPVQTLQHIFMQHRDKEMHLPYWNTGSSLTCEHICISSGFLLLLQEFFARRQHWKSRETLYPPQNDRCGYIKTGQNLAQCWVKAGTGYSFPKIPDNQHCQRCRTVKSELLPFTSGNGSKNLWWTQMYR